MSSPPPPSGAPPSAAAPSASPASGQQPADYEALANVILLGCKAHAAAAYQSRIKPLVQDFRSRGEVEKPGGWRSLCELLRRQVPAALFERFLEEHKKRRRAAEWQRQGFTRDPMEDLDSPLDAGAEAYRRSWHTPEIAKAVSLEREQYELITGSTRDIQAPFPARIPESLPIEDCHPSVPALNLLTPRMCFARLRLPPYSDWQNSPHAPSAPAYTPEAAANDPALALLSEALELFVTRLITGAVRSAQADLDPIRLLEAQRAAAAAPHVAPPPLAVRIACDLEKQVARQQHAAGMLVRRQELALAERAAAGGAQRPEAASVEARHLDAVPGMAALSRRPALPGRREELDRELQAMAGFVKRGRKHPLGEVPGDGTGRVGRADVKRAAERMAGGGGGEENQEQGHG